jgi:ATP-dependent DNA helicase DinG
MYTINYEREISRKIPKLPPRFTNGKTPIFSAFGCVLLERDTGDNCIYSAVNVKTENSAVIGIRKTPLTTKNYEKMVDRLWESSIAGAGRFEADRGYNDDKLTFEHCREIMLTIFEEILPQHGYAIRKEQISLAEHILEALFKRSVSLSEAEVGTGKTLAYLIAAILAKRGRMNEFHNGSFFNGATPYAELQEMPIVVTTSSIALQKALIKDFIPELSRILIKHGIIKKPIKAVMRKGREHYVCEYKLRSHIPLERDKKMKKILLGLATPTSTIDTMEIDGLTPHCKQAIGVPERCFKNCSYNKTCRYLRFREQTASFGIDIQVCNHNYFLADIFSRRDEQYKLIPNYQSVIIDEAHKFLDAARTMYGAEFSNLTISDITAEISDFSLKNVKVQKRLDRLTKELKIENAYLFGYIIKKAQVGKSIEDTRRFSVKFDSVILQSIRLIRSISDELLDLLGDKIHSSRIEGRVSRILWELEHIRSQADLLLKHNNLICWFEKDGRENRICAIPKDLNKQLHRDIWSRGIPTILTSGTLSAGGDFSHTKRTLGLDLVKRNIVEISKPSPFNHRENVLLYTSKAVPFPDQSSKEYIAALTLEIERLIKASHGHAVVLFTSYNVMGKVFSNFRNRGLSYPLFRLDKGGVNEIERFKKSKNGVLFASGALWEGIDIPGDSLSMLIIVKLPFAVPDPISEYERTLYSNMREYMRMVIIPEMLIKLKQGFGRLIRVETDIGVVAILDLRADFGGVYRDCSIKALPFCRTTREIGVVERFFRQKKSPEYFL